MREEAYIKSVQKKIDVLGEKKYELEKKVRLIERQISDLQAGQSPIKPGDMIEFESGGRIRKAKVISVRYEWDGFVYRCHIVTKAGKRIGYANVHSKQVPVLAGSGE